MRTLDGLPGEDPSVVAAAGLPRGGLFKASFEMLAGRPLPQWERVGPTIATVRLRAGQMLFDIGVEHPYLYLVRRGSLKVHAVTPGGREHVIAFCEPPDLVASVQALGPTGLRRMLHLGADSPKVRAALGTGRTNSRAVAVTPCELERLDFRLLEQMMGRHPEWGQAAFAAMTLHALVKERRERELLQFTPEERYRRFLADYPHLPQALTQRDLAGYLGVTPVGLSRIASRVRRTLDPAAAEGRPTPSTSEPTPPTDG